jgi:hypothetical protein
MGFKVCEKKCAQCLFTENRIVSKSRMAAIIKDCKKNDSHFICHKATIEGKDVCCRGFFETQSTNLIRIAQRLNAIEFVATKEQA